MIPFIPKKQIKPIMALKNKTVVMLERENDGKGHEEDFRLLVMFYLISVQLVQFVCSDGENL